MREDDADGGFFQLEGVVEGGGRGGGEDFSLERGEEGG